MNEPMRVSARVDYTPSGLDCRLMVKPQGKALSQGVAELLSEYGAVWTPEGDIYCHGDSYGMLQLACLVSDDLFKR